MNYTKEQIAAALDYAVLKPTAIRKDVVKACLLAGKQHFASICVRPCDIRVAREVLYTGGFDTKISTVIGFPHGTSTIETKRLEAQQAVREGAKELDIVVNYSRILEKDHMYILDELYYIVDRLPLIICKKIILEVCYLTPDQIFTLCQLIRQIPNISFVKTSTGFGTSGASVEAIKAMKAGIKDSQLQIKASGGINTYADVCTYLDLGCARLGSSKWEELLPNNHE
jgi:deoxyribose-phosphate aldolase